MTYSLEMNHEPNPMCSKSYAKVAQSFRALVDSCGGFLDHILPSLSSVEAQFESLIIDPYLLGTRLIL